MGQILSQAYLILTNSTQVLMRQQPDVYIKPSRYEKLFQELEFDDNGDDKDDLDRQMEEEDEGEEELNWMGKVEGRKRRGDEREKAKMCMQCKHKRRVVQNKSVKCPECDRAMYCSQRCLRNGRSAHLNECLKATSFKRMENIVKFSELPEMNHGRSLGSIKDLPGLEHEFLGGSKTNVLLRIGKRQGDVFHCEDIDGKRITIYVEHMVIDSSSIQKLNKEYDDCYIYLMGAYLQMLPSCSDLGIVIKTKTMQFYATNRRDELNRIFMVTW